MTKEKLLESLKAESVSIEESFLWEKLNILNFEISKNKTVPLAQKLSKYNIEIMLELKNKILAVNENDVINDVNIQMLKSAVDTYMDKYAEGQEELKTCIRIVAVYLTFVVKRPLHPVSIFDMEGRVLYKNGKTVCPLRKHEINKPDSLCHFCVSIS
ncbi:MAG: DUF2115 domain-containing protein [Treponema sp.]|jgi:uncharacterized protein (UPF0305 family)|nr:DUF2115 domain-containing protein [Treponema sp.]